jgi:hypothetical protein
VSRNLRDGRQLADRQHAFSHAVGRHCAEDLEPVRPEIAEVRTQGGGEAHLDSHGDSGAADLERTAARQAGREATAAALVLVLPEERAERYGEIGWHRSGRFAPENLGPSVEVVELGVVGGLIMYYTLGRRAAGARL